MNLRCGLVGKRISHSRSPFLFKSVFPSDTCTYDLFDTDDFSGTVRNLLRSGYTGVNVTTPYKEEAFLMADERDRVSCMVGASNTLVFMERKIVAWNTDYDGVKGVLAENEEFSRGAVLVLGCGPAARAAALAAVDMGRETYVLNRTFGKAERFASAIGASALSSSDLERISGKVSVVVSALPTGVFVDISGIDLSSVLLLEANYAAPQFSGILCGKYVSGLKWLVYQAIPSYERFSGMTLEAAFDILDSKI